MTGTAASIARRYDRKRYLWSGAIVFALLPVFGGVLASITGYAGMILLAYFPPFWYRVMDPKVAAQYGGDIRRANLEPDRAGALLKKYPPPAAAC